MVLQARHSKMRTYKWTAVPLVAHDKNEIYTKCFSHLVAGMHGQIKTSPSEEE